MVGLLPAAPVTFTSSTVHAGRAAAGAALDATGVGALAVGVGPPLEEPHAARDAITATPIAIVPSIRIRSA
jgi:hypothetical protein